MWIVDYMKIKSKKLPRKKSVKNPYDSNKELTNFTLKTIDNKIVELKNELKKNDGYYSSNVVSIKVLNFIKAEMLSKDEDGDCNFPNHWTYNLVADLSNVFQSIFESGYMDRNY